MGGDGFEIQLADPFDPVRAGRLEGHHARLVVPASAVAAPPSPPVLSLAEEEPVAAADAYPAQSEEVVPVPRRPSGAPPYGRPRRDDPYDRDDGPRRRRPYYDRDDISAASVKRPPIRRGGPTNAGAIAGILMMVGAVVWFVVGLSLDIIFFYPPILFIIGLIAFIKGLASRQA